MDYKKLSELSNTELVNKKLELEKSLKELTLNSSLTSMEKPHLKRELKTNIAQINGLLAKGEK